jgi:enoyl-CoA hydratase/carnithine racemase
MSVSLRIASGDAQFGLPEIRLGIIPAAGATQTLPRTIGRARTLEILLNGRWISAEETYEAKLINRVVARDTLLSIVESIAAKIASYSPVAVMSAKQTLIRGCDLPLAEGLEMEKRLAASVQCSLARK